VSDSKVTLMDGEDLSARARRGSLSDAERRALEHALAGSATLRVAHQVGCDFDRVGAVQPGDYELIARVVESGVRAPRRSFVRRSAVRLGLALAATLAATSAAAAWWSSRQAPRTDAVAAPASVGSAAPARSGGRSSAPVASAPLPAASALSADPSPSTEDKRKLSERHEPPNAKSLFRDANAARRAGDFARASALYAELDRTFPRSDEARLAHVSAGKLLLSMGKALDAERHFRLYLKGGGELAEEALVGRAQALRTLGRVSDERQVWQELLTRFPSSVYATRARQRLVEPEPEL
jgi:tetratricopeptide (TPR) repeat protein